MRHNDQYRDDPQPIGADGYFAAHDAAIMVMREREPTTAYPALSAETLAEWTEALSLVIAKARYGPGVDMGGKHNPLPSEVREARFFLEAVLARAAPTPRWCARYYGSDGTLCATHNRRFADNYAASKCALALEYDALAALATTREEMP